MFTLILLPIILVAVIVRLITRAIFNPYRIRRPYFGPYGYYGYGHCYRRHRFPGGGLLTIFALVALERLFGHRW